MCRNSATTRRCFGHSLRSPGIDVPVVKDQPLPSVLEVNRDAKEGQPLARKQRLADVERSLGDGRLDDARGKPVQNVVKPIQVLGADGGKADLGGLAPGEFPYPSDKVEQGAYGDIAGHMEQGPVLLEGLAQIEGVDNGVEEPDVEGEVGLNHLQLGEAGDGLGVSADVDGQPYEPDIGVSIPWLFLDHQPELRFRLVHLAPLPELPQLLPMPFQPKKGRA